MWSSAGGRAVRLRAMAMPQSLPAERSGKASTALASSLAMASRSAWSGQRSSARLNKPASHSGSIKAGPRAALQQLIERAAPVELAGHLADHAGGVSRLAMGGRQQLEDDAAVRQMHGGVERLGHACQEQGEQARRPGRVAQKGEPVAKRMHRRRAKMLGERLADHERRAIREMVGDAVGNAGHAPIVAEHDREAARLDLGKSLAA
jgi:hypothetical protein